MCSGAFPESATTRQCLTVMRTTPGRIKIPSSMEDAHNTLPEHFEINIMNGQSLTMLEQVITHVYMPLLAYHHHRHFDKKTSQGKESVAGGLTSREPTRANTIMTDRSISSAGRAKEALKDSANKAMLRDEFLINMQKFTSSIARTSKQIEGEVRHVILYFPTSGWSLSKTEYML